MHEQRGSGTTAAKLPADIGPELFCVQSLFLSLIGYAFLPTTLWTAMRLVTRAYIHRMDGTRRV